MAKKSSSRVSVVLAVSGEPSAERRQHGRVSRAVGQVVDAQGAIGRPYETEALLAQLERHGAITRQERAAGEEFQRLFRLADLDQLRAADMGRVVVSGSASSGPSLRAEYARERIARALDAMGPQHAAARRVCWHVLGEQMSLREFQALEGWEPRRPLSREAAKGTLIGVLGVLEKFFGIS